MDVTNIEENLKFVLFGQFVHPFLEIFTNTLRVIFFISNLLRSDYTTKANAQCFELLKNECVT